MLQVKRFINELMTSNCYVVYDDDTKRCLVIDPGSEKSLEEIAYIENNSLHLDYIIITHEHTDHNWGVNALREQYQNSKLICSEICSKNVKKTNRIYFLFYYDDPDYRYEIAPADIMISIENKTIMWGDYTIKFLLTPGHSKGAMCIYINNMLFTGDTIMPFNPYFNGRDSNEDDWIDSIKQIMNEIPHDVIVHPGHGELIALGEWIDTYYK